MTAPYGKSYPPKCVIFIDPEISESITPGDRVLARISNGEYVFKELSIDGGRRFLRSLNQQYPPIHDKFRIIGKVIGKWGKRISLSINYPMTAEKCGIS